MAGGRVLCGDAPGWDEPTDKVTAEETVRPNRQRGPGPDYADLMEPRPLSPEELGVIGGFLESGSLPASVVTALREQARDARVVGFCACGTCPSVDLHSVAPAAPTSEPRIVLGAAAENALILLFIDEGRLSYLELAPTSDDATFETFPPRERIRFDPAPQ